MPEPVHLESITQPVDYHDPVLLFHHLVGHRPGTLLLESADTDSKRHLNSYLLLQAAAEIRCSGQTVTLRALTANGARRVDDLQRHLSVHGSQRLADTDDGLPEVTVTFERPDPNLDEDKKLLAPSVMTPLRVVNEAVRINSTVGEALFVGGLFGYDLVECFEPLPETTDPGACPNYLFFVAEQLLHLDHQSRTGRLIGSYFYSTPRPADRQAIEEAANETAVRCRNLNIVDLPPATDGPAVDAVPDKSDEQFAAIVTRLKENILRGDVFQIVPSRSFRVACQDPLRAYRQLRLLNPSPYMFFMRDREFTLFGASPEMAVRFDSGERMVEVCPIAGTRQRGKNADGTIDADLDSRIELELRTDTKEMAEHLMLVDLARNDLARICRPGTRHVARLLKVDRYSHVMHLVSRVAGTLRDELDSLHAWQACMNMGTLTGAPKVRAMQLIRETEGTRRDNYGGAIGYWLGSGDMETCIVIRSALVVDGVARIQAGAGVVYDSVPLAEAQETTNKAAAVLAAIRAANGLLQ